MPEQSDKHIVVTIFLDKNQYEISKFHLGPVHMVKKGHKYVTL